MLRLASIWVSCGHLALCVLWRLKNGLLWGSARLWLRLIFEPGLADPATLDASVLYWVTRKRNLAGTNAYFQEGIGDLLWPPGLD